MGRRATTLPLIAFAIAAAAFPFTASSAEDEAVAPTWRTKADLDMNIRGFGYAPADIVSTDGDVRIRGDSLLRHRGDFRFRLFVHGEYLHLEMFPYTVVPEPEGGGYKVSLAGLEVNFLAPVQHWLRVGLYHHSAHNFSLADHGTGIDLNAIVVDAVVANGKVPFLHGGEYLLRMVLHHYSTDKGSPYVLTEDTDVDAADIGNIKWRVSTELAIVAEGDKRSNCTFAVAASRNAVASMVGECDALFAPGNRFFGVLGDHLFIGPYLRYGQNIHRVKMFGRNAVMGGVRLRLAVFDDGEDLKFR